MSKDTFPIAAELECDTDDCKITRVDQSSYSGPTTISESFVQGVIISQATPLTTLYLGGSMLFSHELLREATNNFSKDKLVGKGGFGRVFKGRLRHSDVAIKVLNTVS